MSHRQVVRLCCKVTNKIWKHKRKWPFFLSLRRFLSGTEHPLQVTQRAEEGLRLCVAGVFFSIFEILNKVSGTLKLVGLTVTDVVQMLEDSGITLQDLMEVVSYVASTPATPAAAPPTAAASADSDAVTSDDAKAAVFLLKQYEQTLADWLMTAGYDALHPAYPLPAQ